MTVQTTRENTLRVSQSHSDPTPAVHALVQRIRRRWVTFLAVLGLWRFLVLIAVFSVIVLGGVLISWATARYYGWVPPLAFWLTVLIGLTGLGWLLIRVYRFWQARQKAWYAFLWRLTKNDQLINLLEYYQMYREGQRSSPVLARAVRERLPLCTPDQFTVLTQMIRRAIARRTVILLLASLTLLGATWVSLSPQTLHRAWHIFMSGRTPWKPYVPYQVKDFAPRVAYPAPFLTFTFQVEPAPEHILIVGKGLFAGTRHWLMPNPKDNYRFQFRSPGMQIGEGAFTLFVHNQAIATIPVRIVPAPTVHQSYIVAQYPRYLNRKPDTFHTARITVPEGTELKWYFAVQYVKYAHLVAGDSLVPLTMLPDSVIIYRWIADTSVHLQFLFSGRVDTLPPDSLIYTIHVRKDAFPSVALSRIEWLNPSTRVILTGSIWDDYGFTGLWLIYRFQQKHDPGKWHRIALPIHKALTFQPFQYLWHLDTFFAYLEGGAIQFYLEVRDNDALHGFKRAQTQIYTLKIPSLQERQQATAQTIQRTASQLSASTARVEQAGKETQDLLEQFFLRNPHQLRQTPAIQELQALPEEIRQFLQQLQQELEQQTRRLPQDTQLHQWTEQLQKRIQEILQSPTLQKLEELARQLDSINPNQLNQWLQQYQWEQQTLQWMMERLEELWKRWALWTQLEIFLNELQHTEQLLDSLKNLTVQPETKQNPQTHRAQIDALHQTVTNRIDTLTQWLRQMDSLNQTLTRPFPFDLDPKQLRPPRQQMQQAQPLEPYQRTPHYERARQQLRQLRQQLAQQKAQWEANAQNLSLALINYLIQAGTNLSLVQEEIYRALQGRESPHPETAREAAYQALLQMRLPFFQWGDSLLILARQTTQISMHLIEQYRNAERLYLNTLEALENRSGLPTNQDFVRTREMFAQINELVALLRDLREQALQQMLPKMVGGGACQRPGQGQGTTSRQQRSLSQRQMQLARQLEQLLRQQGQLQGKNRDRYQQHGMHNAEIIRLMLEQMKLREALRQLRENLPIHGKQDMELRNQLQALEEEMRQIEQQLRNPQAPLSEIVRRQQALAVRLLEAERALREQRVSNERLAERPDTNLSMIQGSARPQVQRVTLSTMQPVPVPVRLRPQWMDAVRTLWREEEPTTSSPHE